ncbi:Eco57I restriction-modification methylase domain-containing protein [Paenibacillus polymyxa]|uniref:Eco57I restriction-modification methylase domain-containing protein n=1 Tax=Paenibacillus polymyxa TaxID=1406 RepID=UPI0007EBD06B|nr:Eco57I restriction-modification methylase domain-containing protein [Paenibacillus polymyxa]MDN4081414.1 Eco57I restriction-modification methylase domain-containing protein [Paenibacillus polymyxa]MDN4109731.1 Eco57I restriction-modification methylase domain-containing protein [Paenibacillus polymyxa]OAZ42741.1 hypothetical protein A9Z39_22580 [Paenibacillus polymyxa]
MAFLIQGGELVFNQETISPNSFPQLINDIMTATRKLIQTEDKEAFEQFFTDVSTATFMASLFKSRKNKKIKLLDAGAGIGVLGAAVINEICSWENKPEEITLVAYEIDKSLIASLQETLYICEQLCSLNGIKLNFQIIRENFISSSVQALPAARKANKFDLAILNPPYKKISSDSEENRLLLSIGVDVSNQYAAFVSLVKRWLVPKGEFVAITPRSFCNGQYFRNFRSDLTSDTTINHFHLFDSRTKVFSGEEVLQESVIYHAIKQPPKVKDRVTLTFSQSLNLEDIQVNQVLYSELVHPDDPLSIFRLVRNNEDDEIKTKMHSLPSTLNDLQLALSTGPVVDFREPKETLIKESSNNSVPLIYPEHFSQGQGFVKWPKEHVKKYNCLITTDANFRRLRPNGNYVVVKRMTSKEELRRVVAAVYQESDATPMIAFENKINFYHTNGAGFDFILAKGLSLYLNSTLVDRYFRQFSGNTQVNATDLRMIRYPSYEQLMELGSRYTDILPDQQMIDLIVDEVCF